MTDEKMEKAFKAFKKNIAGFTQDEVDRMDYKDYAKNKDLSLEGAVPKQRANAEKLKQKK